MSVAATHRLRLTQIIGLLALAVLALVLMGAPLAALHARSTEFDEAQFEKTFAAMDRYQRKKLGCPDKGYPPQIECHAALGLLDYQLQKQVMLEVRKFADVR